MHGTGELFGPLIASLPAACKPVVVSYPVDLPLGYAELHPLVEASLPSTGKFALLGESFSGPLAIRIAADRPPRLAAVILAASFVRAPVAKWASSLRWLVGRWCFRLTPPAWVVRAVLAGSDATPELVEAVRLAVAAVAPAVMARRLREALAVDARDCLPAVRVPILSLVGSRDRLVSRRSQADLAILGDMVTSVLMESPRLVLQRQPAAAARAIAQFLSAGTSIGQML